MRMEIRTRIKKPMISSRNRRPGTRMPSERSRVPSSVCSFFRSSSTCSTYCSRSSSPKNRSATASGGRRLLPESSIYP